MKYYTYKITFKDLPGYFYYGKHKFNGKPYFGSPATWGFLWLCFEPEVQVLQWYETEEEVREAERSIILATWKDRYSLNEAVGPCVSERICSKNGKKNAGVMNDHPNTIKVRSENGRKGARTMNDHPNTKKARSEKNRKNVRDMNNHPNTKRHVESISKRIVLVNITTGEVVEFCSAHEAARQLGLHRGHISAVASGKEKQHKGYTAMYV
jgi:hypothetical protein